MASGACPLRSAHMNRLSTPEFVARVFGLPGVIFATPMAVVLIKLTEELYVRAPLSSA